MEQLGVIPAVFGGVFLAGLATGMGLIILVRKVLKIGENPCRETGLQ